MFKSHTRPFSLPATALTRRSSLTQRSLFRTTLLSWGMSCALLLAWTTLASGCSKKRSDVSEPAETQAVAAYLKADAAPAIEHLEGSAVPLHYAEASTWNSPQVCPEGAKLGAFAKFRFPPSTSDSSAKQGPQAFYYGRSCAILTERKEENGSPASTRALPHGPFIYWYESGKIMSKGSYERGTLSTDWKKWNPDGSLVPQK